MLRAALSRSHGQAKTNDEDPERPLTDLGVDDVARVARHAVEKLGVASLPP